MKKKIQILAQFFYDYMSKKKTQSEYEDEIENKFLPLLKETINEHIQTYYNISLGEDEWKEILDKYYQKINEK